VPELSYQVFDSPLGKLLVAATDDGICSIEFGPGDAAVADLCDRLALVPRKDPELRGVIRDLTRYLGGRKRELDLPVDLCLATPFGRRVLRRLMKVGFGELTSYGALARDTGSSPRAVGGAVGSNPVPIVVPCHRVVAADGSLGGYSAGLDRKRMLLELEGHRNLRGGWPPRRRSPAPASA
jgi:methylated-DNA-[protein]-cysteine S-methyltransferase